ncbi:putative phosphatidylethanolamine-binding protein [Candidatus Gastranaerophilus sp. (ex Termes propinquus)]|nr:putative phosphatidylethanolamine-binding protein [Candidatus Gastranaerophilus sp. (ex Termes propinquus)]
MVSTLILGVFAIVNMNDASARGKFVLKSKTIKEGMFLTNEQVYNGLECAGKNISPDLEWLNPPRGAKSYTLIMHDPDAPVQGGWWHWIVVNIPSVKTNIQRDELLVHPIVQTYTSFETPGYGGPCPPQGHGRHRYIFTIYALDTPALPIYREDLPPWQVEEMIKPHVLDKASITTYYERK